MSTNRCQPKVTNAKKMFRVGRRWEGVAWVRYKKIILRIKINIWKRKNQAQYCV